MKNISALSGSLIIAIFILLPEIYCIGQKSDLLPSHISLSFNGTFKNELTNFVDQTASENGTYLAKYKIGAVSDENREIKNFRLFANQTLLYSKKRLPGADFYVSNAGYVAVVNMDRHFMQEVSIYILNPQGVEVFSKSYRYASGFGFSTLGKQFVIRTDKFMEVINCENVSSYMIDPASQFAFSENEKFMATAFEDEIDIYKDGVRLKTINTGIFYPRSVAISEAAKLVIVIDKKELKNYSIEDFNPQNGSTLGEHHSYRDLRIVDGKILAGVHYRHDGVSKGLLYRYNQSALENVDEISVKHYQTFESKYKSTKNSLDYETIPWPFVPFDEVHKVWNHYEQHMGDGSGDWSYLHQGLDLETPIAEPTYAVQAGVVKLVLTLGGEIYWRVAVAPEQSAGYSDGWLYAHLIPTSIQVDVGDEVEIHDYLGDIIAWTSSWGHIHFVNIHDQGLIWYYDDDEWGINFNPLLALDPITDEVAPIIENFSANSKFGFTINQTNNFMDPMDLSGEVDIIVEISDFHGDSEWEQPAFKTYYWLNKLPENTTIFPKTLGQILNHTYPMYNSGFYQSYAPILYFKDNAHPSPPWMNFTRDYFQILTNNNGDSIIDLSEANLAFNTAAFEDGMYRLYVEAWDEFGNMAVDSQDIVFDNFNTGTSFQMAGRNQLKCYPNPTESTLHTELPNKDRSGNVTISIYNSQLALLDKTYYSFEESAGVIDINTENLKPGLYILELRGEKEVFSGKFIKH